MSGGGGRSGAEGLSRMWLTVPFFLPVSRPSFLSLAGSHLPVNSRGLPGGSDGKNPLAMREIWVWSLGWENSPGGGHGDPLQYSCLENPMDRGAWRTTYSPWGCRQLDKTGLLGAAHWQQTEPVGWRLIVLSALCHYVYFSTVSFKTHILWLRRGDPWRREGRYTGSLTVMTPGGTRRCMTVPPCPQPAVGVDEKRGCWKKLVSAQVPWEWSDSRTQLVLAGVDTTTPQTSSCC